MFTSEESEFSNAAQDSDNTVVGNGGNTGGDVGSPTAAPSADKSGGFGGGGGFFQDGQAECKNAKIHSKYLNPFQAQNAKISAVSTPIFTAMAAFLKAGFKPVPSPECLYMHVREQVFLSVYVDDLKMAGKNESIGPLWAELQKTLDLDSNV